MSALKTMAIVYEALREEEFKNVLSKLAFDAYSFIFIRVDPQQEGSYTFSGGGELAGVLEMKLKAVNEIFIINPKGSITPYLRCILDYAWENAITVNYLYKYCYSDCTFRKNLKCTRSEDMYFIPNSHKLLPACESYTRIYDNIMISPHARSLPADTAASSEGGGGDESEEVVDLTLMFQ